MVLVGASLTQQHSPAASAAGPFAGGFAMVEDIVGCVIAVAFGVAVAFQIGGGE